MLSYHREKEKTPVYDKKIGNFKNLEFKQREHEKPGYGNISPSYVGHFDGKYMDFLDVDICGYVHPKITNFEGKTVLNDFGDKLVSEFSYNIDKVYFDGDTTVQTKEFQHDFKYSEATLVSLSDISNLPFAMKKFDRLKEKYPHLMFKSTVLELKQKEEDKPHKEEYYNNWVTGISAGTRV